MNHFCATIKLEVRSGTMVGRRLSLKPADRCVDGCGSGDREAEFRISGGWPGQSADLGTSTSTESDGVIIHHVQMGPMDLSARSSQQTTRQA